MTVIRAQKTVSAVRDNARAAPVSVNVKMIRTVCHKMMGIRAPVFSSATRREVRPAVNSKPAVWWYVIAQMTLSARLINATAAPENVS